MTIKMDPDWITPLGKKVRGCTPAELSAIALWFAEIGSLFGDRTIGEVLSEDQLQEMLAKQLAVAEAAGQQPN